jgi:hypothetical protein
MTTPYGIRLVRGDRRSSPWGYRTEIWLKMKTAPLFLSHLAPLSRVAEPQFCLGPRFPIGFSWRGLIKIRVRQSGSSATSPMPRQNNMNQSKPDLDFVVCQYCSVHHNSSRSSRRCSNQPQCLHLLSVHSPSPRSPSAQTSRTSHA